MTYVLILHVVGEPNSLHIPPLKQRLTRPNVLPPTSRYRSPATALVSCVAAIIFRLLDTVDNVSLLCFPALLSWFTSACTLAAFVIDLAMFYIAKARIDSVDGASAKIGVSVWFTLVAWVLPVFASCFCGINQVENRRSPKAPRPDDQAYPQSAGGYARVPGPPLNTYPEREVSVPLDPDADNKKSDDDHTGMSNNHNLGYSSQDQHYQPRRNPSSNYGHGTYPPRDPYSTGYYREYGDGHEHDAQGGDLGAGTGMGTYAGVGAGAAAVGAGAAAGGVAAGYGQRTPSVQGHGYGYDGYQSPPRVRSLFSSKGMRVTVRSSILLSRSMASRRNSNRDMMLPILVSLMQQVPDESESG